MLCISSCGCSSYIISVNSKFSAGGGGGGGSVDNSLPALKSHDSLRHLHILAAGVDLPIGGIGRADTVGLAFLSPTYIPT